MLTDEDLRDLNNAVYLVDKEKNPDAKLTGLAVGKTYKLANGTEVHIVDMMDCNKTGFQGLAVAPIVNGVPDLNQITIVASGTDSSSLIDLLSATNQGLGMYAKDGSLIVEGQRDAAMGFVKKVNAVDGNNVSHLSGYSQSAYMLEVGGQLEIPTTVFNGWLRYSSLSPKAKQFIKDNPHLFINYRHDADLITTSLDGNIPKSNDFGTIVWMDGSSHSLNGWMFDKDGNIILNSTSYLGAKGREQKINNTIALSILSLSDLRNKFTSSGGGLSTNEEIYLDNVQALMAVNIASMSISNGINNLILTYQASITEVNEVWVEGVKHAKSIGTLMNLDEIREALSLAGATFDSIVDEPIDYYKAKIAKANTILTNFETLATEIKSGIEQLVRSDQELSDQLGKEV